jgi:serine/threonine-protein kinase RIO1
VLSGIEDLAKAGVVHSDLSPYDILVFEGRPWFIDLSEAIRVDRPGYLTGKDWMRRERPSVMGLERFCDYFVNTA